MSDQPSFVDQGRTVDVFDLDFSKASNGVSYNILVAKLGHFNVDGWTACRLKNSWKVGLKGQ